LYAEELALQQSTFSSLSEATKQDRTFGDDTISYVTSALFEIQRASKTLYLVQNNNGSLGLQLSTSAPASLSFIRRLTLQNMGAIQLLVYSINLGTQYCQY
jgi:hypothetical protein